MSNTMIHGRPLQRMLALAAGLTVVACSSTSTTTPAPAANSAAALTNSATTPVYTMYVYRGAQKIWGPDGRHHDTFIPSGFTFHIGEKVTMNVVNYDEGPHIMVWDSWNGVPDGFPTTMVVAGGNEQPDKTVLPVTTTFTFTPNATGAFRWHCATDCDDGGDNWAMSAALISDVSKPDVKPSITHNNAAANVSADKIVRPGQDGYMAGFFYVLPANAGPNVAM